MLHFQISNSYNAPILSYILPYRCKFICQQQQVQRQQKMCHKTCLTCSSDAFTGCLTCQTGLTLSAGTCSCSWWDSTCTVESSLRQILSFLDFFLLIYLVGLMILYVLRIKLPISYRMWNALNALSLVFYSQIMYFDFEDEYALKSLVITNGPNFLATRVSLISIQHIFPTVTILGAIIVSILLMYMPFQVFNQENQTIMDYLKQNIFVFLDSFYFFSIKMMCYFIGKTINEAGGTNVVFIIITAIYGTIILAYLVKFIYQYHQNILQQKLYPAPLYLYTLLSPLAIIGLPLVTSSVIVVVIYCTPFAFLILIAILNKQFKIFTKPNAVFYAAQIVMIGFIITFVLVDSTAQSYIMLSLLLLSIVVISGQMIITYRGGIQLKSTKVYPEEEEEESKKKIIPKSSKYI